MFDDEQTDVGSPAEQASLQSPGEETGQQDTVVVVKCGPLGKAGAVIAKAGGSAGQAAQGAAGAFGGAAKKVGGVVKGAAHGVADTAGSAVGAIRGRLGHGSADDEVAAAIAEEVADISSEQTRDTVAVATEFIRMVALRVRIDRTRFLETELRKQGVDEELIEAAIKTRPAAAGIPKAVVDRVAKDAISFETRIASATSFAAGLPGGYAVAVTIPADLVQYYAHVFRLMQKLAYIYGWQSFLDDCDEVDDETLYELVAFLSVALGIQGAGDTLTHFAVTTAQPAIAKRIAAQTLTKTAWYNPLKAALRAVGVSLTKSSFGHAASKVVPIVSGFACGGITFAGLKVSGKRLSEHLAKLPQADPNMEFRAREIVAEAPPVDDTDDAGLDADFVEGNESAEESDV